MPRRVPPPAGTNARRLLSASLGSLLLLVVVPVVHAANADEASPASALDALDSEERGDARVRAPDLSPKRASFPLRASPGGAPGEVRLVWTPPRASRVLPSTATGAVDLERFRARFEDASSLAAEARAYDVRVGACLNDAPTTTHNLYPYAPLPCASVVARDDDAFFSRVGSPRGVRGTSFTVTGPTPGAAYAFRVVTSVAPPDAEDEDAVSGVAVARARSRSADADADADAGSAFPARDVTETPALRFCGASRGAFPNGTALLVANRTRSASACCLACAETAGCNAWAQRGGARPREEETEETRAGAEKNRDGECWLMYAPASSTVAASGTTKRGDDDDAIASLLSTPGWVGGVLDPSLADPPETPTGLALVDASRADAPPFDAAASDFDAYFPHESLERLRRVCVRWDPAPPLPAPIAAERSAVSRYIVRMTSERVEGAPEGSGGDGGGRSGTLLALEAEREADLPPLLCACDEWRVLEPEMRARDSRDARDASFDAGPIVAVAVRVVAENDAGRSPPASLVVASPLLVARALAAAVAEAPSGTASSVSSDTDENAAHGGLSGEDMSRGTCPSASPRAPLAPPLGLRATRLADGAVFVDWAPPPFDAFSSANDAEEGFALELSPSNLGYQVVWRAWDDTNASLSVAPPSAATLADEETLGKLAAPPCGEASRGAETRGEEEVSSCFSAPLATSLRLEGLSDADAILIGVRALTPSGPGPLSAPVVARAAAALGERGREPVGTAVDDDADAETDAETDDAFFESAAESPDATLPAAPALNPPPLYESERVGAVYEQIYRPPASVPAETNDGVAAYDEETETTTTEAFESSRGPLPFAGVGAFDYPGFGYPFGLAALGLGGLGGYGFRERPGYEYGGGTGGGNGTGSAGVVSVTTGATFVTLNVNVGNGTETVRESAVRGDGPDGGGRPSPPPPRTASRPPAVTLAAPPPAATAAIGGLATVQEKDSAPRAASSRDPSSAGRVDDAGVATVRVGGDASNDDASAASVATDAAVVRLRDADAEEDPGGSHLNPLAPRGPDPNPPAVERLDRGGNADATDASASHRTAARLPDAAAGSESGSGSGWSGGDARRSGTGSRGDRRSLGRRGGRSGADAEDARRRARDERKAFAERRARASETGSRTAGAAGREATPRDRR